MVYSISSAPYNRPPPYYPPSQKQHHAVRSCETLYDLHMRMHRDFYSMTATLRSRATGSDWRRCPSELDTPHAPHSNVQLPPPARSDGTRAAQITRLIINHKHQNKLQKTQKARKRKRKANKIEITRRYIRQPPPHTLFCRRSYAPLPVRRDWGTALQGLCEAYPP